jgi:hypothetical protein
MDNLDEQVEFGSGGEEMVEVVCVVDNIVVMCHSSPNESLWVMLVDTPLTMVKEHLVDAWGQEWFQGNYIICGLWYKRLHLGNKSYYLPEDSPPTWVYSHLILASKFPMSPTMHVVRGSLCTHELSNEVLNIIHEGIYYRQLVD